MSHLSQKGLSHAKETFIPTLERHSGPQQTQRLVLSGPQKSHARAEQVAPTWEVHDAWRRMAEILGGFGSGKPAISGHSMCEWRGRSRGWEIINHVDLICRTGLKCVLPKIIIFGWNLLLEYLFKTMSFFFVIMLMLTSTSKNYSKIIYGPVTSWWGKIVFSLQKLNHLEITLDTWLKAPQNNKTPLDRGNYLTEFQRENYTWVCWGGLVVSPPPTYLSGVKAGRFRDDLFDLWWEMGGGGDPQIIS